MLLRKETESAASDFERAEEDSKEKEEILLPRKLSKESELMKSGSDMLNNTLNSSSNILVEPYIASSPDITSITNPIVDKRLNTTTEIVS